MGEDDGGATDGQPAADAGEEPEPVEGDEPDDRDDTEAPDEPDETDEGDAGDAVDVAELQERIADLEAERDDLEAELTDAEAEIEDLTQRLRRKAADFENYKKRQERRRQEFEAAATESLLERLLDVRDNLQRAIDQESEDVDSLREGVKLTLAELDKVLDAEDVSEIDPDPGEPVDPTRHEVMLRVDSEQPADRIAEVYQPGYERGEKVLRSAQVTVSEGASDAEDGDDAATEADGTESETVGEQ